MKKTFTLFMAVVLIVSMLSMTLVAAAQDDLGGTEKLLKAKFGLDDPGKHFKKVKVESDELGYKHVKLQQISEGIPVYGGEYMVHFDNEGSIYFDNGKFHEKAMNFKAKGKFIKEKEAIQVAKEDIGFTEEASDETEMLQPDSFDAELYLYNVNDEYIPVYLVKVNWLHQDSFGDWRVFVNAYNGKVVHKYNAIKYEKPDTSVNATVTGTPVTGTGTGVLGDTKSINLLLSSGIYYAQDITKPMIGNIRTYTANNRNRLPGTQMTDTDTVWDSSVQRAAVDAHYYAGATYDYYYNMFGRNSLDNAGMSLISTVHYGVDYVNAFWNGSQIVFGDGDGVLSVELSGSLDVIAHELTHGVDSYEADLVYQDQSGALSESFSDLMGTAVEYVVQPQQFDWLMGEDIWTPAIAGDALRSMEDPTIYGDPAHMDDYVYTSSDNGGVHTNCGIPNKAAYLVGSTIGVEKMARIYYRALSVYLVATSDFSDCRAAAIQSAADLYGAGGTEYNAVVNAFNAVGIY